MGKNRLAEVPKEMAAHLKLDEPGRFSFHSYRRSAATVAADAGASSEQMVDFFGWSNQKMTTEYISTSKTAVMNMASRLAESEESEEKSKSPGDRFTSCPESISNLHTPSNVIFRNTDKVFVFPNYAGELKF